jgi:protein-tyrosine phosphatase
LLEAGAWTQVNVDSLLGNNREEAQKFAFWLVDHNYVSTLATDAHNMNRKPNLSQGYRIIAERAGKDRADAIRKRMRQIVPETKQHQ